MNELDLDELERVARHDQYAGLAPSYAATTILALIERIAQLERVCEAADEIMAAYVDEFGPENLEEPADYRWSRAVHGLRAALAAVDDEPNPKEVSQ